LTKRSHVLRACGLKLHIGIGGVLDQEITRVEGLWVEASYWYWRST